MDDCQHFPVRITREPKGGAAIAVIRCERCKIETKPRVWGGSSTDANQLWEDWALLMTEESAAKRIRLERGGAAPAPSLSTFSERQAAACWRAFLTGAGLSFDRHLDATVASGMGQNYKAAAVIEATLHRHLKGPVTPQRLTELLVLFRKATRAFHMLGVVNDPKE